jgi:hypothetical protein
MLVVLPNEWNDFVVEAVNALTLLFPRQVRRSRIQRLRLKDSIIVEIVLSLVEKWY